MHLNTCIIDMDFIESVTKRDILSIVNDHLRSSRVQITTERYLAVSLNVSEFKQKDHEIGGLSKETSMAICL